MKFVLTLPPGNHHVSQSVPLEDQTVDVLASPLAIDDMLTRLGAITRNAPVWQKFWVERGGIRLGTFQELLQAWEYSRQEQDFQCQLTFAPGRTRRIVSHQKDLGYHFCGSSLFRKIHAAELQHHDLHTVLDLGNVLNAALASCANAPYMIVMIDVRIFQLDGIMKPKGVDLADAYQRGPAVFPNPFLVHLAG